MNNSEKKQMTYMPSEALDKAINERFKEWNPQAETSLSFISLQYNTVWRKDIPKSVHLRIKDFVDGFTAGNLELRERLENPIKYIS